MVQKLKSVLLIDDDEPSHFMTSMVLKQKAITEHMHFAESAEKAIRYLKSCALNGQPIPELILLDIEMPDMDGPGFIIELKKFKFKPAPVVAYLTGHFKAHHEILKPSIPLFSKPLTEGDLETLMLQRFPDMVSEASVDWRSPTNPQTSGLTLF
jgi:CheY-like chemotaxis protein